MTTEDDFQRQLDEHPDDWQTRLVFADWLQERGDRRAEGYRALAVLRRVACARVYSDRPGWAYWTASSINPEAVLPTDWWTKGRDEVARRTRGTSTENPVPFHRYSRSEAEDCAALAFAKLRAARRAELLAGNAAGEKANTRTKAGTPKKSRKPAAKKSKGKRKK